MKFGMIGAGNMVSAIVKGMTKNGYDADKLYLTSKTVTSARRLAESCGGQVCETAQDVIAAADVVVLGVKPHVLAEILPDLKDDFAKKQPLVVSIAAGKTLSYLAEQLPPKTPIVRVMPNINAKIGASATGICYNDFVTEEQKTIIKDVFSTIGSVTELPESQFSIFGVIGGASVAFAYLYMDALARAALKAGMSKQQALAITAETVEGSAKMILESGEAPWSLIDQVCSPGGTTIEGIAALQKNGFESTIMAAFDAVLEKDKRIGKQ